MGTIGGFVGEIGAVCVGNFSKGLKSNARAIGQIGVGLVRSGSGFSRITAVVVIAVAIATVAIVIAAVVAVVVTPVL